MGFGQGLFWFVKSKIVQAAKNRKFGNKYVFSRNPITPLSNSSDCKSPCSPSELTSQNIFVSKNFTFPQITFSFGAEIL